MSTPTEITGSVATGRIARLYIGQAYGLIRLRNGLQAFFHRSDLQDTTTFNLLQVGDPVVFQLVDDAVSGPRAVRVSRRLRQAR